MWVEREANNFHLVPLQSVVSLPSICVPNLGLSIEGTRDNFISKRMLFILSEYYLPVRIVKSHRIHDIGVFI